MASLVDRSTPISQSFGFIGQEYFVLPALQVEPCQFEQRVIFRTVVFVAQYVMVLIALLLQLDDSFVNGGRATPSQRVYPAEWVGRIQVEIDPTRQPNRIRRRKPPHIRIIKPERIEMQPRFPVQVLPLEPQVLLFNVIRLTHLF